jgi:hypothetical protein
VDPDAAHAELPCFEQIAARQSGEFTSEQAGPIAAAVEGNT